MNVTIIGAGNMGRGIGTRAVAGGHSVTFVDANPENAEKTAAEVKSVAKNSTKVSTASLEDVKLGDIVVLALWYGTNMDVVKQLGNRLVDKVVIDIANPLNSTYDGLAIAPDSSSAEDVAKVAPSDAKVVKAFNTTYAGMLVKGEVDGQPLDVWIAGDDEDAKNKVSQLVKDAGMRPIDAGPLSRARQIEGMQSAYCHPEYSWNELGKCDQDFELTVDVPGRGVGHTINNWESRSFHDSGRIILQIGNGNER